jgi:hypothetical protein
MVPSTVFTIPVVSSICKFTSDVLRSKVSDLISPRRKFTLQFVRDNQQSFAHAIFGEHADLVAFVLHPASITYPTEAGIVHHIRFSRLAEKPTNPNLPRMFSVVHRQRRRDRV